MTSVAVFKLKIIDANCVTVLATHILHALINSVIAQDAVEVHHALVVREVDGRHKALEPAALDDPHVVILFDRKILGRVDHGFGRYIVGLEADDRGKLAEHLGGHLHKRVRSAGSCGAHLEILIAASLDMRPEPLDILAVVAAEITLVRGHYLLTLGKLGGVFLKLRVYGVEIRNGIAPLGA